ncbi:MAG TPA: ATP-dependent DNA helicase RecG [Phycisphaerales bacterium]
MPLSLSTPIASVPGITERVAGQLRELGLVNLGRLLAHLPLRHEKIEAETSIAELLPDRIGCARGEITATRVVMKKPRPRFEAVLIDEGQRLDLVWFNQTYLRDKVRPGLRLRVQGPVKRFGPGVQMSNPKFDVLAEDVDPPSTQARIRPVYPASERVKSLVIEKAIDKVLDLALPLLEEHLPEPLRVAREMPTLADAYRLIHRPQNEGDAEHALRRLAYDELLMLQIAVHLKRSRLRLELQAPALAATPEIDRRIRERFPFELTASQNEALAEITPDLASRTPSNRLIQGDVGSGKTAVALYAMLLAVGAGHQAALMAPTELLAEQHLDSIEGILKGSRVRIALLTGSTQNEQLLADIAAGKVDLIIGTHALLAEQVRFKSLALAVIDEQHRFGVHQRATLREKASDEKSTPHVLVMTATPIPRTLALTVFGDLDVSVIRGLPPGRKPTKTRAVTTDLRPEVYDFIRERLEKGEQAFVVVPAIDSMSDVGGRMSDVTMSDGLPSTSDIPHPTSDIKSVRDLVRELSAGPLAGLSIAPLHGRMNHDERQRTMEQFRSGQIQCLVATTIVEVGVDVPNATIIVIEQADRFGLAQLHQLRGRVGRGKKSGVCVLVSDLAASKAAEATDAQRRLQLLVDTTDGFRLAEGDWELRGSGDFFKAAQSGRTPLKVADLFRDRTLLDLARRDAMEWVMRSPRLDRPEERLLHRRMMKAFGTTLGLVVVG